MKLIKMTVDSDGCGASGLIVKQIPVGPMANFVYLLVDEKSREAMVVDSGWETGPIVKEVEERQANVKFAAATHGHFDHVATLRELADKLGAEVVAHEFTSIDCDRRMSDGEELRLGGTTLRFLHTPGHTNDSVCVYDGRVLFTGDTLFVGTIGRFDRGSGEAIYRSLHEVVLKLPPTTLMYPGHDYGEVPFRSLGEEQKSNPFLMTRDLRSFLSLFA